MPEQLRNKLKSKKLFLNDSVGGSFEKQNQSNEQYRDRGKRRD